MTSSGGIRMTTKAKRLASGKRVAREALPAGSGTGVVWPRGVEHRYGISPQTRDRWEFRGWLPQRDVQIGTVSGWRPETLAAHESLQVPRSRLRVSPRATP